jgi:hypothetical protein
MELGRRIAWVAPVAMLVMAAASQPVAVPRAAADPSPALGPCRGTPVPQEGWAPSGGVAWYRLDPVTDGTGSLVGQRLVAGVGSAAPLALELPAESFASGPVGGAVLIGDDDGSRSRLRRLDVGRGCWTEVAVETAVIRSAVAAPDGSATWEHRVDRSTRADLGVWRRGPSAPGGGHAVQVLAGLATDPAAGRTFSTDLAVAADGRLVVSSCGELACRTRVVDPRSGGVASATGTGPALGVSGRNLVALEACSSLPCPVDARDLISGASTRLVTGDGPGVLGGPADGFVVLPVAGSVAVAGVSGGPGGSVSLRLDPVLRGSTATSGAETPPGTVVLAPGGRIADPGAAWRLDPSTRLVTRLLEVTP